VFQVPGDRVFQGSKVLICGGKQHHSANHPMFDERLQARVLQICLKVIDELDIV